MLLEEESYDPGLRFVVEKYWAAGILEPSQIVPTAGVVLCANDVIVSYISDRR